MDLSKIKLVCSDIDGTLVEEGKKGLNPEYYDEIRRLKEKGIMFAANISIVVFFHPFTLKNNVKITWSSFLNTQALLIKVLTGKLMVKT